MVHPPYLTFLFWFILSKQPKLMDETVQELLHWSGVFSVKSKDTNSWEGGVSRETNQTLTCQVETFTQPNLLM